MPGKINQQENKTLQRKREETIVKLPGVLGRVCKRQKEIAEGLYETIQNKVRPDFKYAIATPGAGCAFLLLVLAGV